ncbi:hypothetical protein A2U01_0045981, partial [Trifolium medium]|nr:hypothetical protein [Trifolium medium]
MSGMHDVFHVSQLRKFVPDSSVTVDLDTSIPVLKIVWEGSPNGEATWELESEMLKQYPHLFEGNVTSLSE